jgi:MFS transporter, DHA1 family, multidrug resistance protein
VSLWRNDTARILISLYAPTLLMSAGQGMVVPTIPTLAKEFEVSAGLAAQLVTAAVLGRTVALIPVGMLVDRVGRRPLLIGGPLLIAAASMLTAVAPVFGLLLVAQFLTGAGNVAWSTAREIAAIDVIRPEHRGRMLSIFNGIHSAGTALGPVLGGVLTDHFSFRSVFWGYALMGLLTLVVSLRIRETAAARRPSHRRFDFGRLSEVEPQFRGTYVVLVANTFVAMMRGALINSLVPLFVGLQLGLSSTQLGTLFGIYGLVNVLMIGPTGILSDTRGRKAVVVPSTYLAAVVFLAFPFATGMLPLGILMAVMGIATGLALGTMATYTYDVIPEQSRARLQAMRRLIGDVGGLSGPIVAGIIADTASPGAAFWAFVPLQLIAGLLITFLARESLHHVRSRGEARPT